jgi:hypothetical protein
MVLFRFDPNTSGTDTSKPPPLSASTRRRFDVDIPNNMNCLDLVDLHCVYVCSIIFRSGRRRTILSEPHGRCSLHRQWKGLRGEVGTVVGLAAREE